MNEAASTPSSPQYHACPPAGLLAQVARHLSTHYSQHSPDFSSITVILPSLRAAADFARALAACYPQQAVLLPHITTLRLFAQKAYTDREIRADSARELNLYQALREQPWFDKGDLWAISAELRALVDEMTRCHVALPNSLEDFSAQLEAAYQMRSSTAIQFEARIVFAAWRNLAATSAEQEASPTIDAIAAYHLGLAALAAQPPGALLIVDPVAFTPAEAAFVDAYGQRAAVHVFRADAQVAAENSPARLLYVAWPPALPPSPSSPSQASSGSPAVDLKTRAREYAERVNRSPLQGRLQFFAASDLEAEALAAAAQIKSWLLENSQHQRTARAQQPAGKNFRIAVITQDRLAARRLRALLERDRILVEDEAGWTFSTLAASTIIMRWLDCLSGNFYYRDLLDLLKSPFIFGDYPAEKRKHIAYALEQMVRNKNLVAGLDNFVARSAGVTGGQEIREALARLQLAARLFGPHPRSPGAWLLNLQKCLEVLGINAGLQSDAAGMQLLALLERWQIECRAFDADASLKLTLAEWRRWLAQQLEGASYCDTGISSPVIFTSLVMARLRQFDGAVLLGSDAGHLGNPASAARFFNQQVRAQLGLPTHVHAAQQLRQDLIGLICNSGAVLVTWQARKNGEQNLRAPQFELLQTFHRLAYQRTEGGLQPHKRGLSGIEPPQATLNRRQKTEKSAALRAVSTGDLAQSITESHEVALTNQSSVLSPLSFGMPSPAVPSALLPTRISPTGYNSLVACPYQYYARYILKLNPLDEVSEAMEKRDYGEWVHQILLRFHQQHPRLSGMDTAHLLRELQQISDAIFAPAIQASVLAQAWAVLWQGVMPKYLEWQRAREASGWYFSEGEACRELKVWLDNGQALSLQGRIDRIDRSDQRREGDAKQYAVIDYKTQALNALQRKLEIAGEDVQLPVYALLQQDVVRAEYLSLDPDKFGSVSLTEGGLQPHKRGLSGIEPPQAALNRGQKSEDRGQQIASGEMWKKMGTSAKLDELSADVLSRLAEMFDQLHQGRGLPANGAEAVACRYCEMRGLCRKDYWDL